MKEKFNFFWKNHKNVLLTIVTLFIVSRLILTCLSSVVTHNLQVQPSQNWKSSLVSEHPLLSGWAAWDSEWYITIAETGYSDSKPLNTNVTSSVGFFPLYPFIIFLFNYLFHNSLISGLIVANLALLISAFLMYLIVKEKGNEKIARKSIWYLFLFPPAYILSALYPESLLLMFWLATILAAEKNKWLWAGIFGFLAAMTKSFGFFIFIPVIIIYFYNKKVRGNIFKNMSGLSTLGTWFMKILRSIRPDILWTLLIPLGLVTVGLIHYLVTGDLFAYTHIQQGAWHHSFVNPLSKIYQSITSGPFDEAFNSWAVVFFLVILVAGYKKISFAYWLFALVMLLFIPSNNVAVGALRYSASIFPLIIILSEWTNTEEADRALVAIMAVVQAGFFVCWTLGYWLLA